MRKLLIVVDPTEKQPGAVQEAERLAAMLGAYEHLAVSIKGGKELRKMHLLLALREYDLVHYLGHICFDTMQSSRSGWLLHNDVLTGADLGKVIPSPLLMFVNAYHIEGTCQPTDIGYKGSALRLGSTFLLAGIPHCITTVGATLDARNTAFAAAFYRHLCEGEDIGTALAAARCEALQQADLHDALWASYVHYGNPTSQLWPVTS